MKKISMKKVVSLMLGIVLILGMVSGCGSSSTDTSTSGASKDNSSATKTDEGGSSVSGTISVVSREDGSGTRGAFVELTGVEEKDADGNKIDHTTTDAIIANSTDVVMNNVAGDSNAIGYVSLGSLNDTVKAVKVDGVEASTDTVKDKSYAISRPFNIATLTDGKLSDAAQDFYNYILSAEGQQIVEDNKYIKIDESAAAFESNGASGKVVVAGSSSVTPVMEKLKEAYEAVNGNVTVEVQQSDSTTGMTSAMEGTCDIGMASRELSDEEAAKLTATAIALDGIAVVVNKENSVDDLTMDQIKGIFTGEITDWSLN
ncbi:MAG: substrate-binding domain-containing protein [Lachnospiraceae bacterium]|nr:substrate-binding domain-containing protein [Lachnospiraceae bacterium]